MQIDSDRTCSQYQWPVSSLQPGLHLQYQSCVGNLLRCYKIYELDKSINIGRPVPHSGIYGVVLYFLVSSVNKKWGCPQWSATTAWWGATRSSSRCWTTRWWRAEVHSSYGLTDPRRRWLQVLPNSSLAARQTLRIPCNNEEWKSSKYIMFHTCEYAVLSSSLSIPAFQAWFQVHAETDLVTDLISFLKVLWNCIK